MFLDAFSLSSGAYRSPFKSEHHHRPEARAIFPLSLSYTHSDTRLAVGQLPASESTRRRRISGLNSRFDRMLWEASLTARTCKSLPRRHKHAYSSSSSSISSHGLATEETQTHDTMPRIGAGLSPISNNRDQVLSDLVLWAINI